MLRKSLIAMAIIASTCFASNALQAAGRPTAVSGTTPVNSIEQADLRFMREEEKLARDVYLQLGERWGHPTFINIANSEQQHMDAMLQLLRRYQITDPTADRTIGEFLDPSLQQLHDSLMAMGEQNLLQALRVGATIEETDIQDIEAAIERSTHDDIDRTYSRLECGSRNHLRAFADAIEQQTGSSYVALMLPQATVDAVLSSPRERCGR